MFVDKLNMSRIALPKVSVVMPAYNVEQYIAQSIESVLASDYPNIELIIVDDGSTDTTFAIAQGYAANDSRVVALTKSNGGQGVARNFGVQRSDGEYILFVDSDDIITKSYISKAVVEMERDGEVKVVTCRGEFFDGRTGKWRLKRYSSGRLARRNVFTISSLMRREDFIRVGGFDTSMHNYCEDWALWIAILKDGGRVVTLPTVEFFYRVRAGSSRFVGRKYKSELITVLNRKFPDFFERKLGGRLYSQRSMSKYINLLINFIFPRRASVSRLHRPLFYFVRAVPGIIGGATECDVVWNGREVTIARIHSLPSRHEREIAMHNGEIVGYCTEYRFWLWRRCWEVRLKG